MVDVKDLLNQYIEKDKEKIDYIKKQIASLDWDDKTGDVPVLLLYEYASNLSEMSGVSFESIVDKVTSINTKLRFGNWRSPEDDGLTYDGESVTSSQYQNGKRKGFGAQNITIDEPGKTLAHAIVLYDDGIDLEDINDLRHTLFHEWTHIMELEKMQDGADSIVQLDGRAFRNAEKKRNNEVWHTGLVTQEFGANLTNLRNAQIQRGEKPVDRIMHNQITEGAVESIARRIMGRVIGKEKADEVIDATRYRHHVKVADTLIDLVGEKEFISEFITTPSKLVDRLENARIGDKNALHYMADFVDDEKGFCVIPGYDKKTRVLKMADLIFRELNYTPDELKTFRIDFDESEIHGNSVDVLRKFVIDKVNQNLNSKRPARTVSLLAKRDNQGRNPIQALIEDYSNFLQYEQDYYEGLPGKLKAALEPQKEQDNEQEKE